LLNLLNNALEAMPDGGELKIIAEIHNDEMLIRVADTGVGISTEQLPLIFEPFFTSKGQGTGLGLAISYNIISDRGGEIRIESKPGVGTVVSVSLPLNQIS
ncbi:MAG: histidine kinase, partial [Desulfuromusa sp.]|nr:histidine kinase [Desulfuromusa sp.]